MSAIVSPKITPAAGAGATAKLAEHVAAARYEDFGPRTIHAFKRAFQDHLACAIAGSAMPVSRVLLEYFEESDATRVATVMGTRQSASASTPADAQARCTSI